MADQDNPLIIDPTLTLAGQAAAFNADNDGIELKIDAVSFGRGHYDPTGDEVALVDQVGGKVPLTGGSRPTPYQLRMNTVWKENVGQVPIGEIGYWSGDVLVFVWSKADGTIVAYKTDGVPFVLFNDLAFASVPAGSINIVHSPEDSAALAALGEHEGAGNAHPQYLLRADVAKDSGPLAWLGDAAGTPNALVLTLDAAEAVLPAYGAGQRFQFKATANNSGPVTASINGLAHVAIKKAGDAGLVDLDAGDIKAGAVFDLNYDGAYFQLGGGVGSGKAFERFSFTAGVAQSVFIFPHTPGSLIALRNGREVTGFTSDAQGSKVTMEVPCNVDDSMEFLAFKSFKVADSYTKAEVEALLVTASGLPVGTMLPVPKASIPPGFLELDGSVQSSAVYPDLAAYLGTTFNQGNEPAGYFRLPDSRGEFLRGWDHGRGVDTDRALGSLQLDALQKVTGRFGRVASTAAPEGDVSGPFSLGEALNQIAAGTSASLRYLDFDLSRTARTAAETRPRNLAVMWCIKAWNAPVNQGNIDVAALAPLAAKATEISLGVSKIGSQAQVDAGEVDDVIVTPKKLRWGFNAIWGVNGGIAFPSWLGGWIVNWGLQASALSGTISYPIAYTTRAYGIQGQYTHANPSNVNYNITFKDLALSGLSSVPFVSGIANQFQWWGFGK